MPPREDWTDGPAKRLAVFVLGAAVVAGLTHSIVRDSTPWRTAAAGAAQPVVAEVEPPTDSQPDDAEPTPRPVPAAEAIAVRVNINTALIPELDLLPGIGPSLAARIIAERERGGPFGRIEDLGRVRGIGPKIIENLRPHVVLEPAP